MLNGVHEQYQGNADNATTPTETIERYPLVQVTREFQASPIEPQNLVPKLKNLCQEVWDAGLIPVVSFKFSVDGVLNGKWRPFIEQAVSWLKSNNLSSRTIICIWHEPENDVPKFFKDGPAFVKYFNIVHDWIKAVDPNVYTTHAALAYRYGSKNMGTASNPKLVPIDIDDATAKKWVTKADIHSLDIYSGRSFPLAMGIKDNPAFKRWYESRPLHSAWGLSERGWIADSTGSAARVAAIRAEFDYLASLAIEDRPYFYIVWTTEGTENDPKIILDAAGVQAVNDGFARLAQPDEDESEEPPVTQPETIECPLCHGAGTVDKASTYTIVKVANA